MPEEYPTVKKYRSAINKLAKDKYGDNLSRMMQSLINKELKENGKL